MSSTMRLTAALCLSLGPIAAQVEPTEAERAFAAILKDLPEDQARARLAGADPSQVTAGLPGVIAVGHSSIRKAPRFG